MAKETKLVKLKPSVHQELLDIASRREVAIGDVVEFLLSKWGKLQIFNDIPCKYCGKEMINWNKEQIALVFKSWYHVRCEPKE
jgi:hypothetical protein